MTSFEAVRLPGFRLFSVRSATVRFRGRPPLAPLAFDAAALAFDRRRPPRRPVAAANRRLPNARSTRPGTYTSTSSEGHDNASPAGETTTDRRRNADARRSPGTALRG